MAALQKIHVISHNYPRVSAWNNHEIPWKKFCVSCTVSLQLATNQLVASSAASVREARRFAVLHNICKSLALDCALHVDFRETKCQPKDSQRTTEFAMINQSINIIRMLKSPVLGVILYIQIRQKSVLSLRW